MSEPLLKKKPEKTDTSAIITNPPQLPSIRCTVVPWRLGVFSEHFLPAEFSQSRIDGRRGSTACTVISTLVAKGTLEGELVLPRGGEQPSQAVLGSLVNLLRAGNQLYDNDAAHFGLLAVYHVLDIWPQLGLRQVVGVTLVSTTQMMVQRSWRSCLTRNWQRTILWQPCTFNDPTLCL